MYPQGCKHPRLGTPGLNRLRTKLHATNKYVGEQADSCLTQLVRYGGLLLALYNYNGLVAPGLSLYSGFIFTRFLLCSGCVPCSSGCVPCSSSVHRAPGKRATVPICKVLVRPGRESNFRPTSIAADALTTTPRAGTSHNCRRTNATIRIKTVAMDAKPWSRLEQRHVINYYFS